MHSLLRKTLNFMGIAFFSLSCTSLYAKQDWKMVWNDEFDYQGAPDESKWSFDTEGNNWDWGNDEAQNYTPADKRNAWVENGNLVIEARKERYTWNGDGQTKEYTSARLRTLGKGDWLYGKVEVRALLPKGRGMWPAIWMLASEEKYGGWPKSGELDIMENVGYDPTKIHCNIHTESYNHSLGTNKGNTVTTSLPSENWHIYSLEWDADKVVFFLDGQQVFRFDNEHRSYREWPYDQKFHLLLNVAVGGSWGGTEGIDDAIFPQKMLVDYVRVYQMGEIEENPIAGTVTFKERWKEDITIDASKDGLEYQSCGEPVEIDLSNIAHTQNDFVWTYEGQIVGNGNVFKAENGEGTYHVAYTNSIPTGFDINISNLSNRPYVLLDADTIEACENDMIYLDQYDADCVGCSYHIDWKKKNSNTPVYDIVATPESCGTYYWTHSYNDDNCYAEGTLEVKLKQPIQFTTQLSNPIVKKDSTINIELNISVPSDGNVKSILWKDSIGNILQTDSKIYTFVAKENQTFYITMNDDNYCPSSDSLTIYVEEGTEDILVPSSNIIVSPTIATDYINIIGIEEGHSLSIFTIDGTLAMRATLDNGNKLDINSLPQGIYYLLINNKVYSFIKKQE